MTALILESAPLVRMLLPKLDTAYRRLLRAIDDFAEARMRRAVPQWQMRRVQREIECVRRLIHAKQKVATTAPRAGR
jgi:hypothetical protein